MTKGFLDFTEDLAKKSARCNYSSIGEHG
ncbi:uncharacterized protein G2W53_026156 [Senna tora]|uniref:Uncharacterized protein n=1 Tax=Senna tora TaxID=362788 RepID=A0A834WIJ3_9FABA|nr:uncharacterized protein G2W53_026156 [Senna tora]